MSGRLGIDPEPERDTDRVASGAQQRNRAVDAAAHRHCHPRLGRSSAEGRPDRRRQRLDGELVPVDRGSLEQRQAGEVLGEPVRVGLGDLLTAHAEAHGGPVAVPGGVPEELGHALRLAGEHACAVGRGVHVLAGDLAVLEGKDVHAVPLELLARLGAGCEWPSTRRRRARRARRGAAS